MTILAHKLRYRGQIKRAIQDPNSESGGFIQSYETLLTLWLALKPISHANYIRGVQVGFQLTHEVELRRIAVASLGKQFASAFSTGFDVIGDLRPLKGEYFIFVRKGSSVMGLLLRVRRIMDVGERKEYLNLLCEEIEEHGTGWS